MNLYVNRCPFPECRRNEHCRAPENCAVPIIGADELGDPVTSVVRRLAEVYSVETDQIALIRLVADARDVLRGRSAVPRVTPATGTDRCPDDPAPRHAAADRSRDV